jgi:hypothetical protein
LEFGFKHKLSDYREIAQTALRDMKELVRPIGIEPEFGER